MCIVQLNVAYNFKRQAIDTDTKLHQYIIEHGLQTIEMPQIQQNNVMQINQNNYTTTKTTTSISLGPNNFQHRPFIPVQIKSEPIDYEILSDITIDTNTETDDGIFTVRNYGEPCTPFSNNFNSESTQSPHSVHVPSQSMVRLNDNNFLRSTPTSDMEFMKNYLRSSTLTNDGYSSVDSMAISPTISDTATLVIANVKSTTKYNTDSTHQSKANESGDSPDLNKENYQKHKSTATLSQPDISDAAKKSKKKGIPYSLLRLMPDGLNLPADQQDIKPRRRNKEKLLKIAVNGRLRRNLTEKVINPANRLRRKIIEEKEKIIQRQTSNRLHNASDARRKFPVTEKGPTDAKAKQTLKMSRQRVSQNKRKSESDMKQENDVKKEGGGRITRNFNQLMIKPRRRSGRKVKLVVNRPIRIGNNDLFRFPNQSVSGATHEDVTKSTLVLSGNAGTKQL